MWREYIHGIGNNKLAREFTFAEHGKYKVKYSRRNIIWRLIAKLVDRGLSASEAIDRIYTLYGPKSPTELITRLHKDRDGGNFPFALRCFSFVEDLL